MDIQLAIWMVTSYLFTVRNVDCGAALWYQVYVSKSMRLDKLSPAKTTGEIEVSPTIAIPYMPCSIKCSLTPWCQLFCHDPSSNICLFYDMIVKPKYQETFMDDALICYTRLPNDYTVGAIVGGPPHNVVQNRVIASLVDGIYGYQISECYQSIYKIDPFVYIDLEYPVAIKEVTFSFQNNAGAKFMFNLEVRVHPDNDYPPVDAASGEFFGDFAGPAVAGEMVYLTGNPSFNVRYVTIQRFTADRCDGIIPVPGFADCCIVFCYLDIS